MKETTKTKINTTQKPIWELTPEEALTTCDIAKFLVLRSAHLASGNPQAITDLQNQWYKDKQWRAGQLHATISDWLRDTADSYQEDIATLTAIIDRVTTDSDTRAEAYKRRERYRTIASEARAEAHDIDQLDSTLTASEGEAIFNAVYLMYLRIIYPVNKYPDMKPDPDKAFKLLCEAGRTQLETLRGLQSLDTVKTTSRPMTKAEAMELMTLYGADPASRPRVKWTQTAKNCTANYYTLEGMECKTLTKNSTPEELSKYARYNDSVVWFYENITQPSTSTTTPESLKAWYSLTPEQKQAHLGLDPADNPILCEVLHRPSYRRIYDLPTRGNEDNTPEQTTAEATAIVDIIALANRARLTDRQRRIVKAMTTPEAIAHATRAYLESWTASEEAIAKRHLKPYREREERQRAKHRAEGAYTTALWDYAMEGEHIKETARAREAQRTKQALVTAYHQAPDSVTPGTVDIEKLMKRPGTIANIDRTKRPRIDQITITDSHGRQHTSTAKQRATAQHKPVIRWTENTDPSQYQYMSQEEADRQRAEEHRQHIKSQTSKATPAELKRFFYRQTLTAEERAIFDKLTPRRQTLRINRERAEAERAKAERAEAERRAKFPEWVYSLNSTFQQWSEASEETRAEHMAYLNSL